MAAKKNTPQRAADGVIYGMLSDEGYHIYVWVAFVHLWEPSIADSLPDYLCLHCRNTTCEHVRRTREALGE